MFVGECVGGYAGDQPLQIRCRQPPGRFRGSGSVDQSLAHVIAIATPVLDRMARGQPSVGLIEQPADQRAWGYAERAALFRTVLRQARLHLLPERRRHDPLVLARMRDALVPDAPDVDGVA